MTLCDLDAKLKNRVALGSLFFCRHIKKETKASQIFHTSRPDSLRANVETWSSFTEANYDKIDSSRYIYIYADIYIYMGLVHE